LTVAWSVNNIFFTCCRIIDNNDLVILFFCSADLKNKYLDFSKQHGWKESGNFVFRVNTAEGYEALNLKSNNKNKHNIILSIGEDKIYFRV
jgi:hypothetical protein